ncbi:hypothetical protein Tco_1562146 [Tanacetum coccineum]
MRTRNSYYPNNSPVTIPRRRNRRRAPNVVEPELRTIVEVTPMADNRTMEELLQAPTEGYGEAIVIPEILAENFEIKTNLLQLVQANKFHGFERDNPHTHIDNFKRMTATLKYRDVPNDVIKLMLFPYSLEGAARIWYEKKPPNSILTWDDLIRDQAYENSLIYKERTKKLHDSKIKNRIFNVGGRVLLFNSCLKIFSGKVKTRWLGPFTITQVFPYGTVELSQPDGPNFKVNGHRVKHYFGGDIPSKVVPDLQTIPMDN